MIIREFILHTVTTLSLYTHIFQLLAFSSEDILKAVIRNPDALIFTLVSYRKYIRSYVVFFGIRSQELILTNVIVTLES